MIFSHRFGAIMSIFGAIDSKWTKMPLFFLTPSVIQFIAGFVLFFHGICWQSEYQQSYLLSSSNTFMEKHDFSEMKLQ